MFCKPADRMIGSQANTCVYSRIGSCHALNVHIRATAYLADPTDSVGYKDHDDGDKCVVPQHSRLYLYDPSTSTSLMLSSYALGDFMSMLAAEILFTSPLYLKMKTRFDNIAVTIESPYTNLSARTVDPTTLQQWVHVHVYSYQEIKSRTSKMTSFGEHIQIEHNAKHMRMSCHLVDVCDVSTRW